MSAGSRPSFVSRWLSSSPPSAAIEIAVNRVTAAVIAEQGGSRVLASYASEPLAKGAIEPALNAPNVHDATALSATVGVVEHGLFPAALVSDVIVGQGEAVEHTQYR